MKTGGSGSWENLDLVVGFVERFWDKKNESFEFLRLFLWKAF
jgi:hypothetical protein